MLNPIALSIGPLPIHWYGIIIGIGALLGLILAIWEGKRFGIGSDFFMDLLLIGVPSALLELVLITLHLSGVIIKANRLR